MNQIDEKKFDQEKDYIYEFEEIIKINKSNININKILKEDRVIINSLFNLQYKLAREYLWTINLDMLGVTEKATIILATAWSKNNISLYTAYRLTNEGLYGPARLILRHCFEFLMLSKYCALTSNDSLLQKWDKGDSNISLTNDVLNKLKKPKKDEFFEFWKLLCKFTHATIYSNQPGIKIDKKEIIEIKFNYLFIRTLLECNYHLLNSYLINDSIKFYGDYYGKGKKYTSDIRKKIRSLLVSHKKDMKKKSKKLIYDYKLKWTIK